MEDKIKFSKLDKKARIPTRNNYNDAGIDLYALGVYVIPSGGSAIVRTGIRIRIPKGYFGLIKPKSKNKYLIGAGVIDEGYQGEILIKIFNVDNLTDALSIYHGMGIAQLVLIPTIYPEIDEIKNNILFEDETNRGSTGGIVTQLEGEHE